MLSFEDFVYLFHLSILLHVINSPKYDYSYENKKNLKKIPTPVFILNLVGDFSLFLEMLWIRCT